MGEGGRAGCVPGSVHTHTDGEGEQRFVCAEHMKSYHRAPPSCLSPAGCPCSCSQSQVPVSPGTGRGAAAPAPRRGWDPPTVPGQREGCLGQRIARSCISLGATPEQLPGLGAPLPVRGDGGAVGAPPARPDPPHTAAPFPPLPLRSVASLLPSPFSSAEQEFSHHPLAEECVPPRRPQIPGSRGSPAPPARPGFPSPAPGVAEFVLTPCLPL